MVDAACMVGAKGLGALIEGDQKQAAKYRCSYCRADGHSTQEFLRPGLTGARKAELVKCQIVLPLLLYSPLWLDFARISSGEVRSKRSSIG